MRHDPGTVVEGTSLARNSAARLAGSASILAFGFVTSVVTARFLGPAGKGTLSTLSILGDIVLFYLGSLGLGEAAIILVGRNQVSLQRALAASILPLLATGMAGALALVVITGVTGWDGVLPAAALQGAVLLLALQFTLFMHVLNARERFVTSSLFLAVRFGVTALATWILLSATSLGVEGAVLGAAVGVAAAGAGDLRALRRLGLSVRPVWDWSYLRLAARFGVAIQASYLLMAMSQRADQLLVYSLAGSSVAGHYAVALTLGLVPAYLPVALAGASFPRLARIEESEVWALTAQTARIGLLAGAVAAAVLAVAVPLLVAPVFGAEFQASARPALVLLVGGLIWSLQWILARAWAARGRTTLLVRSFLVTLAVMVGLDLLLIPPWGTVGAALASVAASAAGLGVCVLAYRDGPGEFRATDLVPRSSDVRLVLKHARGLMGSPLPG